jgi:hypothetical protein
MSFAMNNPLMGLGQGKRSKVLIFASMLCPTSASQADNPTRQSAERL